MPLGLTSGCPLHPRRFIFGPSAFVLFGCSVHVGLCDFVRQGTQQGCPTSGSVCGPCFSIASPVDSLRHWRRRVTYPPSCDADDLAASMLDVRLGFALRMPVLLEMRLATGLTIHPEQTQLVHYGFASEFDIKRMLQEVPGAGGFAFGVGRYMFGH